MRERRVITRFRARRPRKAALEKLLRNETAANRLSVLLDQYYHRTLGCGLDDSSYGFELSVYGTSKGATRIGRLRELVERMIAVERSKGPALSLPEAPCLSKAASLQKRIKIGPATVKREGLNVERSERMAALVETEDDVDLTAFDDTYLNRLFYEDEKGRRGARRILEIGYNDCPENPSKHGYYCVTERVDIITGATLDRPNRDEYGLERQRTAAATDEIAEFERMFALYETEKAAEASRRTKRAGKQQKKARDAAAGR